MGKYYKTYTVKPLPPFTGGYIGFLQNPWKDASVKRVAWLIYPALRDLQVQVVAIQSLTGHAATGFILWERTRGKMYTFVVRSHLQKDVGFYSWKFNSDVLRRLKLNAGIVKQLRPLDTWAFLIQKDISLWSHLGWPEGKYVIDSPAIGYWVNRELLKTYNYWDEERDAPDFVLRRPMNFGCFKDNVYHHSGWHTPDSLNVWRKRWNDEHSIDNQDNS